MESDVSSKNIDLHGSIVACGVRKRLTFLSTLTGEKIFEDVLKPVDSAQDKRWRNFYGIRYSPGSDRIAIGTQDSVLVYNIVTKELEKEFVVSRWVYNIDYLTSDCENPLFCCGNGNGSVTVFDRDKIHFQAKKHLYDVRGISKVRSINRYSFSTAGNDSKIHVYDVSKECLSHIIVSRGYNYGMKEDIFKNVIISGKYYEKTVHLYDVRTFGGSQTSQSTPQVPGFIYTLQVDPPENKIWVGDRTGNIIIFDNRKLSETFLLWKGHEMLTYRFRKIDQRRMASCSNGGNIKIWNLNSYESPKSLGQSKNSQQKGLEQLYSMKENTTFFGMGFIGSDLNYVNQISISRKDEQERIKFILNCEESVGITRIELRISTCYSLKRITMPTILIYADHPF